MLGTLFLLYTTVAWLFWLSFVSIGLSGRILVLEIELFLWLICLSILF